MLCALCVKPTGGEGEQGADTEMGIVMGVVWLSLGQWSDFNTEGLKGSDRAAEPSADHPHLSLEPNNSPALGKATQTWLSSSSSQTDRSHRCMERKTGTKTGGRDSARQEVQ